MEEKGIIPRMQALDVTIVNFDDLGNNDWVKVDVDGSHWKDGFRVARPILEADCPYPPVASKHTNTAACSPCRSSFTWVWSPPRATASVT